MDVRNCKGCGKLFNYIGGQPLCPECLKAIDVKFDAVKEYVYDHPNAGMQEVSDEMGVTIAQIKRWIREERLSFSDSAMVGLDCEGCGKMIRTGRFCDSCKAQMINGLNSLHKPKYEPEKKQIKDAPKMRFLDN